jgi:thiol-disulfide isomerase/thioredoxin
MAEQESSGFTTVLIMVVLVATAGAGVYFFSQKTEPASEPDRPQKKPLGRIPPTWAFTDLEGKQTQIGDLRGKVVFINLWATTCPPCVREMPSIQALYESLSGSDFAFVILSPEPADKVKAFVKKQGWSVPIYLATEGVPPVLNVGAVPVTVIVNRDGEVVSRTLGAPPEGWDTGTARALLKKAS